jgi:hypothetical protein
LYGFPALGTVARKIYTKNVYFPHTVPNYSGLAVHGSAVGRK